jgi:threonine dehydratase
VREPGPADIEHAREAIADVVRRTPVLPSATLSERTGGDVLLKAESLQRTGSFKIRGALNKLGALGEEGCARGVVAASAGNHAQALAHAARARGVPCEVFMPRQAPIAKVEGAEGLGAKVLFGGDNVDECLQAARARATETGMAFVHPFDDPDVVAGQGTLGLELLEDVPDLAKVVVPVGGGGLVSGLAIAIKSARPEVAIVGVQVEMLMSIADGIAVKQLGELTSALIDRWVDELIVVPEDDIAEAMVLLMEKAKLVVEGAGAVGAAALVGERTAAPATGTTVVVLSGGNVDPGLLADVARRHETRAGRRLVVMTRVADRPGSLARLLERVGSTGANLVELAHVREGLELHIRETGVQLVLETRGPEHADEVIRVLEEAGYPVGRYSGVAT